MDDNQFPGGPRKPPHRYLLLPCSWRYVCVQQADALVAAIAAFAFATFMPFLCDRPAGPYRPPCGLSMKHGVGPRRLRFPSTPPYPAIAPRHENERHQFLQSSLPQAVCFVHLDETWMG